MSTTITVGEKQHDSLEFLAVIAGGSGPDVWDAEATIYATSIRQALAMLEAKISSDESVISIEQVD